MFRKIIVGCEGSPQCHDALALASRLAEHSGGGLIVNYVYYQQPRWFGSVRDYERERREEIRSVLEPALATLPDTVRVQSLAMGSSSPARGLHDLAEEEKADLLVLGSTHRGRVGRILPGSVAKALLAGAPCAVAVAPNGYRDRAGDFGVIGAGFDGSEEAERMLGIADRLATALGARLRAIAVAEPHHFPRGNGRGGHPLEERLAEALAGLGRSPDSDGVLLEGRPAEALAEAASAVDVLVAGSRGYGPLHHAMVGSVSAPLMRNCPCPLIITARGAPVPA
jgi:nucleotide-binding universal stress UspA family protein